MSVKKLISELFAAAAEEGNSAVIAAIAPFIDVSDLANKLDTDVMKIEDGGYGSYDALFTDAWRASLTRSEYSVDEIAKLTWPRLIKHLPGYLDFIAEIGLGAEVASREKFISRLLGISAHEQALTLIESLPSLDEMKLIVQERIEFYDHLHRSKRGFLTVFGPPSRWSRTSVQIMAILGVELDPAWNLEEFKESDKDDLWTRTRFAAQVDYVSDLMDAQGIAIPTVLVGKQGAVVSESMLGEAFALENERVNNLGGWHRENFPNYYPALARSQDMPELEKSGVVALKIAPDTELTGWDGGIISVPVHAFVSTEGQVTNDQVNMAVSLLSRARVTELREALKTDPASTLVLVPDVVSRQPASVPHEFAVAMKFYRPEALRIRGDHARKLADNLDTRLYLAGVPSGFVRKTEKSQETLWLKPEIELHSKPEMVGHFNEPGELAYLYKAFTRIERDRGTVNQLNVGIYSDRYSLEENHQAVLDLMDLYKNKVGDIPFRVVAPLDFLQYFADQKMGFKEEVQYHVAGAPGSAASLFDHPRLRAALGQDYSKCIKELGETPEDWVAKAVRTQDERLKEKAAGMLDRLPLEEVALLATTDAKAKYLMAHFNFVPVAHVLPKKVRDRVLSSTLETDLGL